MKLGALVKSGPKAVSASKFFGKKKNQTEYNIEQRSLPVRNIKKSESSIIKTPIVSSQNKSFFNGDSSSPFTSRKGKDNDLIGIAKSIEKKVIKIDSLLKESYAFKVKNAQKETQRRRSSKLEEKESDLERKEKSNLQSKIKIPGGEKVGGIFGWLKNFIFWMFLAWLRDKILPFIPTISNILGKALNVASFALEVFGGIANVLTKFLAGGIRLVNGLTKTLAIVSGARTEEEIESFTKKFNLMMDLALLAAMLAGDAGFSVLDLFKKKKGRDAAGKALQKAGGVFKRGLGRAPQRIAAKLAGKKGATVVKGLTTGAKALGNKATGNIFRRGAGKATQRLAIKLGGKAGGQALSGLSKAAGPIGTVIGAGFEFAGRKSEGQSNLQAGVGTGSSVAGALAGGAAGAKGGALAGAAIGALFGGVGAVPGAAIGGFIGGIAGAIGGGWLAGKAADKVTGADKVGQQKENTVPGKYRGGIVGKYERGGIVDREIPRKEKFQKTYVGKDIGGYSDIVKLFPDPSGNSTDGYSRSDNNQVKQKDWWNAIFGGNDEKSSDSKPKGKDSSHKGKALESLKDTSETFKKNIPFVGELMGASIDIAMGQKPERSIFRKLSERIIYIGTSLSNVEKISDIYPFHA